MKGNEKVGAQTQEMIQLLKQFETKVKRVTRSFERVQLRLWELDHGLKKARRLSGALEWGSEAPSDDGYYWFTGSITKRDNVITVAGSGAILYLEGKNCFIHGDDVPYEIGSAVGKWSYRLDPPEQ